MRMRIKAVVVCTICILSVVLSQIAVFGMEFSDVPITATYYKAVNKLSNDGIIQGRGDGKFGPRDRTTRAEFCAFVARANNYNENYYTASGTPFTDVARDSWAQGYISYCYENGYVNGMTETSFSPNDNVTAEQAIKVVVCASGLGDDSLSKAGPMWYSGYVDVAKKSGLLDGGIYTIGLPATRAFVAQIVYNSMLIKGESQATGTDAVDVSGNRLSSGTTVAVVDDGTVTNVYEPENIWEPDDAEALEREYYQKVQYYGEDYEKYIKEEENSNNYTVADTNEEYEYVPIGSSDGMLIVIDPGHNNSGVDTGATGNGLREQDITFYIAEKLKPLLERNGFQVIMTRNSVKENVSTESVSASLARRADIANRNGADLFVSIHCNAGGGTGTETYYCTGSSDGKVFATFIQEGMLDAVGLRNRGVKNARYAVLRNTNMTAALLETGFIDSANDAKYLGSEEYQQAFAEGIAKGICNYVGIEYQ